MKCTCKIGYGWENYKCLNCGGDIRGVWGLTTILDEVKRKKIREGKNRIALS